MVISDGNKIVLYLELGHDRFLASPYKATTERDDPVTSGIKFWSWSESLNSHLYIHCMDTEEFMLYEAELFAAFSAVV
jgi:hypothetical protein